MALKLLHHRAETAMEKGEKTEIWIFYAGEPVQVCKEKRMCPRHTPIFTHTHTLAHNTHTCIVTYTNTHACIFTYTNTSIHILVRTHTHIVIHTQTYPHTHRDWGMGEGTEYHRSLKTPVPSVLFLEISKLLPAILICELPI